MNKFGVIKTKILNKLTESYAKENKAEIKEILTKIKGNKDFKEMYLFYEGFENKYIENKETAKLYLEDIEIMLNQQQNELKGFCNTIDLTLGELNIEPSEIYESLDILSEKSTLLNLENKFEAKRKLLEHLTTKKTKEIKESTTIVENETLLNAILANNFNVLYNQTLSESEKESLKKILSIPQDELTSKTYELKESITNHVSTLLSESNDVDLTNKLNKVKEEVKQMSPSRYNYYRLMELKNGLN